MAVASCNVAASAASSSTTMTDDQLMNFMIPDNVPRSEDLPSPDDDLYVDVRLVEQTGEGLPQGWTLIDGDVVMDGGPEKENESG